MIVFHYFRRLLTPERLRRLWYAPSLAIAMGLMMARTLIMAHILNIDAFATFSNGVLVSSSFCMLGALGLQSVLQRDWPMRLEKRQEYHGLVMAAQTNLVAFSCALVGLIFAAFGFSFFGLPPLVLAVGLVHGLSQQFFVIATVESRSRGEAMQFAMQNLVRALIALGLGVVTAIATGSALAVLAVEGCVSLTLSLEFFQRSTRYVALNQYAIYRIAFNRLGKINWRSAGLMLGVSLISILQINGDRWFASSQLSPQEFAFYSFTCIVMTIGQSLQGIIATSFYPYVARRYVRAGKEDAFKVCFKISVAILVLGFAAIIPFWIAMHYAVVFWYPRYVPSLDLLIFLLPVTVVRLSDFWTTFLLISHHEGLLFKLNFAALVIAVALFIALGYYGTGHSVVMQDAARLACLITAMTYIALSGGAWFIRKQT
jgi:O-antigen/teichoic acid export membrane protein